MKNNEKNKACKLKKAWKIKENGYGHGKSRGIPPIRHGIFEFF